MAARTEPEIIDLTGLTESSEEDEEDEESSEDEEDEESEEDRESRSSPERGSSDGERAEITVNEWSRAQLHSAISTVSESRLRQILQNLVETIPAVEVALMGELVTLKRKTRDVVSRWETCANCDEEFDVHTKRKNGECMFHPGELEVDEDSFADWDENCHGPMDTSSNRRDYPENFQWTCCDRRGLSEGCVHGEHKSAADRKRRRV